MSPFIPCADKRNWHTVEDIEFVTDTEFAICIDIEGNEEWFAKEKIEYENKEYRKGDIVEELFVSDWILRDRGFLE